MHILCAGKGIEPFKQRGMSPRSYHCSNRQERKKAIRSAGKGIKPFDQRATTAQTDIIVEMQFAKLRNLFPHPPSSNVISIYNGRTKAIRNEF